MMTNPHRRSKMDPLHAAVVLQVALKKCEGANAYYSLNDDVIVAPFDLWTVAHEIGHATGVAKRLNRGCLARYAAQKSKPCGWIFFNDKMACVRIEEAIADGIADALTGLTRAQSTASKGGSYAPVIPGTRAAWYVQVKVAEALEYLTFLSYLRPAA
jgi:hypothetical protein